MAGSSTGGSLISDAKLKQLYATMLACRLLAQHALRLRNPRRALYTASLGHEAIATGCVIDLEPEDTVLLAPGGSIAGLVKGAELSEMIGQLYAPSSGEARIAHNIITPFSTAEQHFKLANQLAQTNQQKQTTHVVVAFTTARAAASARWQRSLHSAARHSLPLIIVVENKAGLNLSLKVPRDGLTRITIDGNDVVAVYRVAYESLERVRQGGGPVLIECRTWQQAGKRLRRAESDPLLHMERYLGARGLFSKRWKAQLVRQFSREIGSAREAARYLRASPQVAND
jgi:acetoin:2,6-dichlorophenolindophenol oxidoreductase subunit alpha